MKVIVHRKSGGGVSVEHLSPSLLAAMTGKGYGWPQERTEYEVGKFIAAGASERVVRPYIVAIAEGGVAETRAIELIRAKTDKMDCLGCTVIEDTELPTDRYFRNAWTWSD
jgi:hypothetical protein